MEENEKKEYETPETKVTAVEVKTDPETGTEEVDEYQAYLDDLGSEFPDMDMSDAVQRHKAVVGRHKRMRGEIDRYKSNNDKLNALFAENPNAAYFMNDMMSGMSKGDIVNSFLSNFGEDFKAILEDPTDENKERFAKSLEGYAERCQEDERIIAELEKNEAETRQTIADWVAAKKFDEAQKAAVITSLSEMANNFLARKITAEMLEAAYKSANYDDAVKAAREEGLAEGRNETIRKKTRAAVGDGMPIVQGGGGAKGGGKPKDRFLAALGGYDNPLAGARREKY
ncbi:MAG: hypothetical protein HUK08_02195 [Bacteroidaceae bacterium]|nr:hypothetical protein [Bacteroidaceae bacterium]